MEELKAKYDPTSSGKRKRYIVGNLKSAISGALYLKEEVELPATITIIINEKKEKVMP